jgi:hypothetical protein
MEKGIGNKTSCNTCKTKVECKLDSKDKLSWYNLGTDQKHYNYNNGEFECVAVESQTEPATTEPTNTQTEEIYPTRSSNNLDEFTAEFVDKQNDIIDGIEEKVAIHLAKKYPNQHIDGARIGLRAKMIWYKLIGL